MYFLLCCRSSARHAAAAPRGRGHSAAARFVAEPGPAADFPAARCGMLRPHGAQSFAGRERVWHVVIGQFNKNFLLSTISQIPPGILLDNPQRVDQITPALYWGLSLRNRILRFCADIETAFCVVCADILSLFIGKLQLKNCKPTSLSLKPLHRRNPPRQSPVNAISPLVFLWWLHPGTCIPLATH